MSAMNVMVIGGTRGIGLALARHYLERGAHVAICGRDPGRVEPALINQWPQLRVNALDIGDQPAVARVVANFADGALDLLIVSAGMYADAAALDADPTLALLMARTNVSGLNHAFEAAGRCMAARGGGQLVALASVAGLIGDYRGGSLYSANKRTVIALCDFYRKTLARFSIAVTVIVPGYVDTLRLRELNGGDASGKPFLMAEADAVSRIVAAISARRERAVFPWQMRWMVTAFNYLPSPLRRLRKK
jgi:NAD(P)-dependent dehydrogenase (short-subunit alcohol dehydrogenase family)